MRADIAVRVLAALSVAIIPWTAWTSGPVSQIVHADRESSAGAAAQSMKSSTGVPSLQLQPNSGFPGATIAVSGAGYADNEQVVLKLYCASATCTSQTVLGTATTDSNGGFSALNVTIPVGAAVGTHVVGGIGQSAGDFASADVHVLAPASATPTATATNTATTTATNTTTATATATNTVTSKVPSLQLQPNSGFPGATIAVSGAGYADNEQVVLKLYCASATCTSQTVLGTATTDSNGGFSALNVTIPVGAAAGAHTVGGIGQAAGDFASAALQVLAPATIADWPEFHADASRSGSQSSDTLLTAANATTLVPLTGAGFAATGMVADSPSVYQGVVYYAANTLVGSSSRISTLYAVDAATGSVDWSEPFPDCGTSSSTSWVISSPAVTTGMVNGVNTPELFVGWGDDLSAFKSTGCMYDFNAKTGGLIWTYPLAMPPLSSPAIMSTDNGPVVVVGTDGDTLEGFSVAYTGPLGGTGPHLWTYNDTNDPPPAGYAQYCKPTGEKCGDAVWGSPAEGLVLVNGEAHHYAYFPIGASYTNEVGHVDAVDLDLLSSGHPALAWSFWTPRPTLNDDFGTVLVLNDSNGLAERVFSGMMSGDMFSLDPATGRMIFDFQTLNNQPQTIAKIVSTGALVTVNGVTELVFGEGHSMAEGYTGKDFGYVFAIDALSTAPAGTLLWRTPDFLTEVISSPAIANQGTDAVAFLTIKGKLYAIDAATGAVLANYPILGGGYGSDTSPAIYGGRVFVTVGNLFGNPQGAGGFGGFRCALCS